MTVHPCAPFSLVRRGIAPFALIALGPGCALLGAAEEPTSGFVVLGGASLPEFEGADAQLTVPFVASRIEVGGRAFEVDGLQFRVDVASDPVLRMGPAIGLNLPRSDNADSEVIARLDERNLAVNGGLFGGFVVPVEALAEGALTGTLTVLADMSGVHDGTTATAELELFFAVNYMLRVGLGVNATLASSEFMESYFSVDAAGAAASGLAAYDASAGLKDVGVELYSILSLNESLGLFGRVAYSRLLSDAADSPIVEVEGDADQVFLGVGVFWRF